MQQRSIRSHLVTTLVSGVLILSGTLIGLFYLGSRSTVQTLTASWVEQIVEITHGRLAAYFQPIQHELSLAGVRIANGDLEVSKPERFIAQYTPLLEKYSQISAVLVADSSGNELMLSRIDSSFQLREISAQSPDRAAITELPAHKTAGTQAAARSTRVDYDPRRRPWYQAAITRYFSSPNATQSEQNWTQPYTFFSSNKPGITASTAWRNPDGEVEVVGFDVHLHDISVFTTHLDVQENGLAVVMTDQNLLIGLPRHPRFEDPDTWNDALLRTPDAINMPLASDAHAAFARRASAKDGPVRFRSEGTTWWAEAKRYVLDLENSLTTVALVPEQDLHRDAKKILLGMGVTVFIVLLIAIRQAFALAHRLSQPIENLVAHSERIRTGDIDSPISTRSEIVEVQQLATAQEKMRTGLRALFDLEEELAIARQIQQNTFPTDLPKINQYSFGGWSLPAEATGGDSYDIVGLRTKTKRGTTATMRKAAFLLADATGHGVGPALSVAQVRAMLRMGLRAGLNLRTLVEHLNEQLCNDLHGGRFITAWFGHLDSRQHTLHSLSAGQAPLLHFHRATKTFSILQANAPPLGINAPLEIEDVTEITLEQGDLFIVASDGILEARNPQGQSFGIDRLCQDIQELHKLKLDALLSQLQARWLEFCANTHNDDATLVAIKRKNSLPQTLLRNR